MYMFIYTGNIHSYTTGREYRREWNWYPPSWILIFTWSCHNGHYDVISNLLWCHQQNETWASETRGRCVKIVVFTIIQIDLLCRVRNKIMYELSWRTVAALTRGLFFWCLFTSLLRNSGNNHQNNPLVSAETVRHSSTYIILYLHAICIPMCEWSKKKKNTDHLNRMH